MPIRLYRFEFSTNVERVTLALAHKDLEVESIWVDPGDRTPVVLVSGQRLVPVLEHDGRVVFDSTAILRYLEDAFPDPPLYPSNDAQRAEMDVFIDWFNRVYKRPPNELEAELSKPEPDQERIAELERAMVAHLAVHEALLARRDYLLGDEFSAADCAAFPFLKYALKIDAGDDELFHRILHERQPIDAYPRLRTWIERVDARPRV
jgi:glutathione S-transferase